MPELEPKCPSFYGGKGAFNVDKTMGQHAYPLTPERILESVETMDDSSAIGLSHQDRELRFFSYSSMDFQCGIALGIIRPGMP